MPVKAYIYAEDGGLLGFMAYDDTPPQILEMNGRFFEKHGRSNEIGCDDDDILAYDYWEFMPEDNRVEFIPCCIACGRNASVLWYKCCPDHISEEGPDVFCQACVELLHPGDPEFARV